MRKVVVTGIGAVTPVGNTFPEAWEAIKAGNSGIRPLIGLSGPWQEAGIIRGFDANAYLSLKEIRRLDPFIHYAVGASLMAVEDARLDAIPSCSGVIIGSSRGGITSLETAYEKLSNGRPLSAYLMPSTTIGMAASYVAQKLSIRGCSMGISNSCSSGANAIGEAYRLIKCGISDVMLAGGAEAPICRLAIEGYGISGALSKKNIMRPFDRKRDGFILAEGAALLVLEEFGAAQKRGAKIYAEVLGYGNTVDAFHETRPDKNGQASAIRQALAEAGISPDEVDYINAHATATPSGDKSEAEAIRLVFGQGNVRISAHKPITGHMLGAGGAFESATTVMSLYTGIIPPTINLTEPEFDLNFVVEKGSSDINIAVSNSFGFGGVNAVLVFKGSGS